MTMCTSCFASHQTIRDEAPCVVYPIRQETAYQPAMLNIQGVDASELGACHTTCYPEAYWAPVGAPMAARYCEESDTFLVGDTPQNRQRLLAFLRDAASRFVVTHKGENARHEPAFNLAGHLSATAPELLAWLIQDEKAQGESAITDALFAQAQAAWGVLSKGVFHGRVFWQVTGGARPVAMAVMHQSAYDELLVRGARLRGDTAEVFQRKLNAIATEAERLLQAAKASVQKSETRDLADTPPELQEEKRRQLEAIRDIRILAGVNSSVSELVSRHGAGSNRSLPQEYRAIYVALKDWADEKLTTEGFAERVAPWLGDRFVMAALEEFNVFLAPSMSACEGYDNASGRQYADFVRDVASAVTRDYDIRNHGAVQSYRVTLKFFEDVVRMLETARGQYEAPMQIVQLVRDQDGNYVLDFDVPLDIDDGDDYETLLEIFSNSPIQGIVFTETLVRR